nr:hypothetical protein [Candidatus Sigynarchaeum springense]
MATVNGDVHAEVESHLRYYAGALNLPGHAIAYAEAIAPVLWSAFPPGSRLHGLEVFAEVVTFHAMKAAGLPFDQAAFRAAQRRSTMTETTQNGDATGADVTARVLAATKELRDGFEGHYAAVAGKVKKEIEGPVKVIDTGDDVPVVMQLSAWDTRMGPVPAMLVGGGAFLARITPQEQDYTTRMMDMLEPGSTCDLSKDGLNRLLLKCAVHGSNVRGGEAWLLLAAYYDPRIAVPRHVVEELLVELAGSVGARPAMAAEALAMRERYDPATSTWRPLLQELRQSIWALVQKAGSSIPPVGIPGLDPAEAKRLLDEEIVPNLRRARGGGVGGSSSDAPRPATKKPGKEAVKAWFMSAYGKLRLEERLKHAASAVPSKSQARKAIVVPPVEAALASPAPAPEIAPEVGSTFTMFRVKQSSGAICAFLPCGFANFPPSINAL